MNKLFLHKGYSFRSTLDLPSILPRFTLALSSIYPGLTLVSPSLTLGLPSLHPRLPSIHPPLPSVYPPLPSVYPRFTLSYLRFTLNLPSLHSVYLVTQFTPVHLLRYFLETTLIGSFKR